MTSLNRILEHPPEALINCVQKMSCEKSQIELSKLNECSDQRNRVSSESIVSLFEDIFVNWKSDGPERNNFLAAFARLT